MGHALESDSRQARERIVATGHGRQRAWDGEEDDNSDFCEAAGYGQCEESDERFEAAGAGASHRSGYKRALSFQVPYTARAETGVIGIGLLHKSLLLFLPPHPHRYLPFL